MVNAEDSAETSSADRGRPAGEAAAEANLSYQAWLDSLVSLASVRQDVASPYPFDVARSPDPDLAVVVGEVAGPSTFRTFSNSIIKPLDLDPEVEARDQYTYLVIPVKNAMDESIREIWVELGLVDREYSGSAMTSVGANAPPQGTEIVAAGLRSDDRLVLVAGHTLSLPEADGSAAVVGRGPVDNEAGGVTSLGAGPFEELRGKTVAAAQGR